MRPKRLAQFDPKYPIIFQSDEQLVTHLDGEPFYHPTTWRSLHENWKVRIERANYFHSLIHTVELKEDPVAYFSLIENALIQACIGMLGVFWKYKPSYTSLSYLVHLCTHFCDFPKTILLNNSF